MAKKKYYAVAKGRKPGIYTAWFGGNGAQVQITGFPGAVYKGFQTRKEAEAFMDAPPPAGRYKNRNSSRSGTASSARKTPKPGIDSDSDAIIIYTDGGALNNPGPGGYGAVILENGRRRELSGGFRLTTNNRMELTACIEGLKALEKPSRVKLFSDSKYVVDGLTKGWAQRWRKNDWMRTRKDRAENADLWAELLDLYETHDVEMHWVKGHAGVPENERCDQLVRMESAKPDLPPDRIYEQNIGA
ncbi:MAG: ribonuclease HI [Thermodesulfobacteriota bacterium]